MTLELAPDAEARMRRLWAAADRALRTDTGMLVELAQLCNLPWVDPLDEDRRARRAETERIWLKRKRAAEAAP